MNYWKLVNQKFKNNKQFFDANQCLVSNPYEINPHSLPSSLALSKAKHKSLKLSTVTTGHVFGLSDYLLGTSKKFYTSVWVSKVATVSFIYIEDLNLNFNISELNRSMKEYWLDTLSVIAKSLHNIIKLELTVAQNFSK